MKAKRCVMAAGEDPPTGLRFSCPGCDGEHVVRLGPAGWLWNGSLESPTIEPSVKIDGTEFSELGEQQYAHFMKTGEHPPEKKYDSVATCCHSVVTEGMIRFCPDCTHALVNQTVPLPEIAE